MVEMVNLNPCRNCRTWSTGMSAQDDSRVVAEVEYFYVRHCSFLFVLLCLPEMLLRGKKITGFNCLKSRFLPGNVFIFCSAVFSSGLLGSAVVSLAMVST